MAGFSKLQAWPNVACDLFLYNPKLRVLLLFFRCLKGLKKIKRKKNIDSDHMWPTKPEILTLLTLAFKEIIF